MKKIKGLLLFGILTLLGIGSSFGYQDNMQSVMFKDNINQHINFNVFAGNSNVTSYSVSSIDSNGNVVSVPFLYKTTNSLSFDISHYSIFDSLNTYSYNAVGLYGDDSCLDLYYSGTSRSLLFHLFGENNCNSSSNLIGRMIYGIYINTNQSCVYSGVMTTGCNHNFYKIFNSQTYDSRVGEYADSNYSGNNLGKASISISFPDVYSFFTRYDLTSSGTVTQGNYDKFRFKTVYRSGDSFVGLPGVYMIRLNDYRSNYTITGFQVMVFSLTGVFDDSDITNNTFYYSIYNCPYNSNYITDCQFSNNGGTFNWSFSSYLFTGNIFSFFGTNLIQYSRIMTNSYNGINLVFHRPGTTSNHGYQDYSFSVGLTSDGNNYFTELFPGGGNGNQSTGSIAINTGLLNLCLNDLQFGELNSYLCNQLLSNLGNPVQIPGTSGQYISVSIDENGNLRYWITTQDDLAEQMSGFVWVENEDGSWSTVCPSGDCLGTVLAQPINHGNTGFEFTTGIVLDMITNLTGWVGRCPFPYTDFRLGKNLKLLQTLQNYGFNYDPFIFVNCAVAGFHYGRHSIDRQIFDGIFEHPLLYGDTQKHRSLFVFLDFIVILGLFGLSAFLKKIF